MIIVMYPLVPSGPNLKFSCRSDRLGRVSWEILTCQNYHSYRTLGFWHWLFHPRIGIKKVLNFTVGWLFSEFKRNHFKSAQIRVNLRFESQVGPLNEIELNLFSYFLLKLSVKPTKIVHNLKKCASERRMYEW